MVRPGLKMAVRHGGSRGPTYDPVSEAPVTAQITLFCIHGVPWTASCILCGRYVATVTGPTCCPACVPGAFGPGAFCPTNCSCRCHVFSYGTSGVGPLY